MKLISYGLGDRFSPEKFNPISNTTHIKPKGGLWSSPKYSNYGWKDWCKAEDFGNLDISFEFDFEGKLLIIDNLPDLKRLPWINHGGTWKTPNFENILSKGYDAIFLTEKGQQETRFSDPSLYGWDCECVFIMNKDCVK